MWIDTGEGHFEVKPLLQKDDSKNVKAQTFTGSCSGSKSCGRPAAYTKKYVDFEKFRAFQTFYSFYRDYELSSKVRLGSSVDKGLLSKHFCLESS